MLDEATPGRPAPSRLRTEAAIRRLLFIPDSEGPPEREVERLFTTSLALSAMRCIFTYMLVPVVLPAVGVLTKATPGIGALLSALALVFDIKAIRSFWWARDSRRWMMTWLYLALIVFVFYLMVLDLHRLHL